MRRPARAGRGLARITVYWYKFILHAKKPLVNAVSSIIFHKFQFAVRQPGSGGDEIRLFAAGSMLFLSCEKPSRIGGPFSLVPETGVEPVRCCHRGILSPLRLPFRHSGVNLVAI